MTRARVRLGSADFTVQQSFSPFVLATDDSESCHADPPGTSLALSDRLAGNQQDCPLYARWRTLRALPKTARTLCRAARRHGRDLVGHRDRRLARWPWSATSSAAGLRAARGDPDDSQAGLSRDRAPQPRPDVQRAALAKPRRALPPLPHDPRCARTPEASLVECVPPACVGRPLYRPLRLRASAKREGNFDFEPVCTGLNRLARASDWLQSGGCRWRECECTGAEHDRSLPDPRNDRGDATSARR